MNSLVRGLFATFYFLVCFFAVHPLARSQPTPPEDCAVCHEQSYKRWSGTVHYEKNVDCDSCHIEMHSGDLSGCRTCHTGKHRVPLSNWPQIVAYDLPENRDYVCVVCHDAHSAKSQFRTCAGCHPHWEPVKPGPVQKLEGMVGRLHKKAIVVAHNVFLFTQKGGLSLNHYDRLLGTETSLFGNVSLLVTLFLIVLIPVFLFPYFFTAVALVKRWRSRRRARREN